MSDLKRIDAKIEKMYLILPYPDYWNDTLVGITLGIEGRIRRFLHPIVATKCIATKLDEKIDIENIKKARFYRLLS